MTRLTNAQRSQVQRLTGWSNKIIRDAEFAHEQAENKRAERLATEERRDKAREAKRIAKPGFVGRWTPDDETRKLT
jgi:hypothetical protein